MIRQPPVGLPIWLLALPPGVLALAAIFGVIAGWGMSTTAFGAFAQIVGGLGVMLAITLSWVLVPVGIYSLAKNPVLRTAAQAGLILVCAIIAALPVLALFGGGI